MRIGIEADRAKSAGRDRARRDEAEMGHAGKSDDGFAHARPPARFCACTDKRDSTRLSQRSVERSVGVRARQSRLKCSYSAAQVGSSCSKVTLCSGGRPLGKTRERCVKVLGPHLHSELICAVPCSARMWQVKWLRHINSVISSSVRGRTFSLLTMT